MTVHVKPATGAEQALADHYRRARDTRRDGAAAERDAAFAAFAAAGLPNRRVESWHYTDLRAMMREAFAPAAEPDAAAVSRAGEVLAAVPEGGIRVVAVDGVLVPALSLLPIDGRVTVTSASDAGPLEPDLRRTEALGDSEAMVALNTAFAREGIVVRIAPGAKVDGPVELVSVVTGGAPALVNARWSVHVGAHASALLVERHLALGDAQAQSNHVLVLAVGDGAAVDHVAVLDGLGARTLHVQTTLARLGADARFASSTLVATEGVTRRQAFLEFAGAASEAQFRGVSLLAGRCHADTTLVVTHTAPGCVSRELFKHVLGGEATGVFQGKVVVAPGAQKTDGKMLSKAIFLDEGASMFNKPELEIFADDVVCGHGATAGSLDDDQLFYIRARGIPLAQARAMLLEAFAADVVADIPNEALAAELTGRVRRWLHGHGG